MIDLLLFCLCLGQAEEPPQVLWQRSLGDAVEIREDRPLLLAVNMDGESACERIVHENYRRPAFVETTRNFSCLISSVFRHSPRDYDAEGRRIPCPRLGEVTCGEHIQLEPILFSEFLGGDRIAPRHALVTADGEKVLDLSLLFDLRTLDRTLVDAAHGITHLTPDRSLDSDEGWLLLASKRGNRARTALEDAIASSDDAVSVRKALDAIMAGGNSGSLDALRIVAARGFHLDPTLCVDSARAALQLDIGPQMREAILQLLGSLGIRASDPHLGPRDVLLPALGITLGDDPGARSLLLSYLALGRASEPAQQALEEGLGKELAMRLAARAQMLGAPLTLDNALASVADNQLPEDPVGLDLRSEEQTVVDLDRILSSIQSGRDDNEVNRALGRASLRLARLRLDRGATDVELLFKDADIALENCAGHFLKDPSYLLDCAAVSHYLGKYRKQEEYALRALGILTSIQTPRDRRADTLTLDAQRWLGDACARLVSSRSETPALEELSGIISGLQAMNAACLNRNTGPTDWISLSSFLGILGRTRDRVAVAWTGVRRFPEDGDLRNELNSALWESGHPDLIAALATVCATQNESSGFAAWHAGYGTLLYAESLRRENRSRDALEAYRFSRMAFERALVLNPEYAENCRHYLARISLGEGFAYLIAHNQNGASLSLVRALQLDPTITSVRDGLDREALDLLDGILEWRNETPSPVPALELMKRLHAVTDEDAPFWARSVSDSELREALRAEGRGEEAAFDEYMDISINAARSALRLDDGSESRHTLAQPLTIRAERLLAEDRIEGVAALLQEAATLCQITGSEESEDPEQLKQLAGTLRTLLGEPRPKDRPGR